MQLSGEMLRLLAGEELRNSQRWFSRKMYFLHQDFLHWKYSILWKLFSVNIIIDQWMLWWENGTKYFLNIYSHLLILKSLLQTKVCSIELWRQMGKVWFLMVFVQDVGEHDHHHQHELQGPAGKICSSHGHRQREHGNVRITSWE